MTILRAVDPEEATRVVTGHDVLRQLVEVMERELPFVPPSDPRYRHLRELHDILAVGL